MLVQVYGREAVSRENVFTLSRREGYDWEWATFGSTIDKQNPEMTEKVRQMLAQEGGPSRFADVNAIKDRVTAVLRSIPQEAFADCFRKLHVHLQKSVVADGDYFEGQ